MNRDRRHPSEHEEFLLLAAASVDGRLDSDSAAALDRHLAACDRCRAAQAAMRADHAWLADPALPALPNAQVRTRIMEAARAPRVPKVSGTAPRPWAAFAAAATIVAVVGGGMLIADQRGGGSAASQTPAASAPDTPSSSPPQTTAVSTVVPGPCAPRPAGITAWWPGEDGREVVGGRDLQLRGGATFAPGLIGGALTLDGVTAYAEVAHDPTLDLGTRDFTLLLWVRFGEVWGQHVIIEQTDGGAGWSFEIGNQTLWFLAVEANVAAASTVVAVASDVWYHVAVRRSGSELVIFRNGKPLGRHTFAVPVDLTVEASLLLGRRNSDEGFLLEGQLDEVQLVAGSALFETDIAAIHRAGQTGFCVP